MYFNKFLRKDLMLNSLLKSFQVQELPLRCLRQIVADWVFFCNCDQFHTGFKVINAQRVFLVYDLSLQQMRLVLKSMCCNETIFKIEEIIMEVRAG